MVQRKISDPASKQFWESVEKVDREVKDMHPGWRAVLTSRVSNECKQEPSKPEGNKKAR